MLKKSELQNFADDSQNFGKGGGGDAASLAALRKKMRTAKLDVFFVPREDMFQGEYVPAANERLKWLTGFGGSAGLAIILARKAALFVDGRYILQAPQQVDETQFEVIASAEQSPTAWLKKHLKKGQILGLDPYLHSQNMVAHYRQLAASCQAKLKFVKNNPLDAIWKNRPPLPQHAVVTHPHALAGASAQKKRNALAAKIKQSGADGFLLTQPEDIAWLLNIRGTDVPHTPLVLSFGLLHKSGKFDWFIAAGRVSSKIRKHIGSGVRLVAPDKMMRHLQQFEREKIGYEAASAPAIFVTTLKNPVAMDNPCALPKACKTKAEIDGTIKAHIRDGAALSRFLCWLENTAAKNRISEIDAALMAEQFRAESGQLRDLSFDTISGTGAHGAIVHYRVTDTSNRPLKAGDLYLIDSGGQYRDGTTDVTRTVLIGRKPPKKPEMAAFTRVLQGHIALARVRFPAGTNGMQLDTLARAPLWQFGQDFAHGTGHGVGSYLSVHEGPQRISQGGLVPLRPGMIVSNEPGYYEAGKFGIRIENLQYVTPPKATKKAASTARPMLGFEVLTLAPIDKRLIDTSQLSRLERAWLNDYHQKVLKKLTPILGKIGDKKTQDWLKKACSTL